MVADDDDLTILPTFKTKSIGITVQRSSFPFSFLLAYNNKSNQTARGRYHVKLNRTFQRNLRCLNSRVQPSNQIVTQSIIKKLRNRQDDNPAGRDRSITPDIRIEKGYKNSVS